MIIEPKIRGFICTTAHPVGCATNVQRQIDHVVVKGPIPSDRKRVLVLGCSTGYGLASRIVNTFGSDADTVGVSFERPPAEGKTASAGWYNNRAFENRARAAGRIAVTVEGDAFSDAIKAETIEAIKANLGQVDLIVYSVASPVRTDPKDGVTYRSAIKPYGGPVTSKTLNTGTGEVSEISVEPATEEEVAATVKVMGGEDWELWIAALAEAGVLADGFQSLNYTYLGSELTWPIYHKGTLGKAKADLDRAAAAIRAAAWRPGRPCRGPQGRRHPGQLRHSRRAALWHAADQGRWTKWAWRRHHRADRPPVPRQAPGPTSRSTTTPASASTIGNCPTPSRPNSRSAGPPSPPKPCPPSPTCRNTARNSSSSSASASAASTTAQDVDPQVVN